MALPGQIRRLHPSENHQCDSCNTPALHSLVTEVDSFGIEEAYLCETHLAKHRTQKRNADTSGCCDWCGKHTDKRIYRRDLDEGHNGPVYQVCIPCVRQQNKELDAEAEALAEYLAECYDD